MQPSNDTNNVTRVYRHDYRPCDFRIEQVDLDFVLNEQGTYVTNHMQVVRNGQHARALSLHGCGLTLLSVALDGKVLEEQSYRQDELGLSIDGLADSAQVTIQTRIHPESNTLLEGLYRSGGLFCTQCEAEGFRRITYYLDRPDVLARFNVRIEADQQRYPHLLSNGNLVEKGALANGRHYALWSDPYPKPAYLFALVAGDLACKQGLFRTASGREVTLQVYSEAHNIEQCDYAVSALKSAMSWDERRFGLEYDLDLYMIVAVEDFNMGAMENKGLNIFNTRYVLADKKTATDADFFAVQSVIAHEYFHNWTGNRVTCRDWFQLSLKEGLTVFRDQEFSADMHVRARARIHDVRWLREHQFREDSGPLAHPVRPESYIEINNFYTLTIYEKGAEVIRMLHTLLGEEKFVRGLRLYLQRHDGQAATCDDFIAAMAETWARDLTQFSRWYSQVGTPDLRLDSTYNAAVQTLTLTFTQSGPAAAEPLHIPVRLGLLNECGAALSFSVDGAEVCQESVLSVTQAVQSFTLSAVTEAPLVSALRGFSAPVRLQPSHSDAQLALLLQHDTDPYQRYDAGQQLLQKGLIELARQYRCDEPLRTPALILDAVGAQLAVATEHPALSAEILTLPGLARTSEDMAWFDTQALGAAEDQLLVDIVSRYAATLMQIRAQVRVRKAYEPNSDQATRRALANLCLDYLVRAGVYEAVEAALEQYEQADNMTDRQAALAALVNADNPAAAPLLADFYQRYGRQRLLIDRWFSLQARAPHARALAVVKTLSEHEDFDLGNPNRARALISTFCEGNPRAFHDASGDGYRLLQAWVCRCDAHNPQLAARLVQPLSQWSRQDSPRQAMMKQALLYISNSSELSNDLTEIVQKSLNTADL